MTFTVITPSIRQFNVKYAESLCVKNCSKFIQHFAFVLFLVSFCLETRQLRKALEQRALQLLTDDFTSRMQMFVTF